MNIHYLGTPPSGFLTGSWQPPPQLLKGQPLFEIDALVVFGGQAFAPADQEACQLVERSGRPVIRVGVVDIPLHRPAVSNILMVREYNWEEEESFHEWLTSRPRTNYQPIDCSFYDRLEAAIVSRTPVELVYRKGSGEVTARTCRLKDTKTDQTEEFLELAGGEWIRLDQVVTLDGQLAGKGCAF